MGISNNDEGHARISRRPVLWGAYNGKSSKYELIRVGNVDKMSRLNIDKMACKLKNIKNGRDYK